MAQVTDSLYAERTLLRLFPLAALYAARRPSAAVREDGSRPAHFGYTERHLQCLWFDPALRPQDLRTARGETVAVEDPGVWNLEAGPDFIGAALRLGPERRRVTGDVEVHVHPEDWHAHGHAGDPAYARVRLHLTYHPGALAAGSLPPGAIEVSLRDALAADPLFSFEVVDPTLYPFAVRAAQPPCQRILEPWPAEEKGLLLDAAGHERLRRKSCRLAAAIADRGRDQVLYEEVLCALGYKHNKAPFRALAERVPVAGLREIAGNDADKAYALLLGVAGLLPPRVNARWDAETRSFVRALWDNWWKLRERWESVVLPASAWRLAGLRPANHPARRLMAAAWIFTRPEPFADAWLADARRDAGAGLRNAGTRLNPDTPTYWHRRHGLGGKPLSRPAAIVGNARAHAIAANVLIPFLAACAGEEAFDPRLLHALPPEEINAIARQTAFALFGPDHTESIYGNALRRHGLLQIFHDFCMNDRSRCSTCPLPQVLAAHAEAFQLASARMR